MTTCDEQDLCSATISRQHTFTRAGADGNGIAPGECLCHSPRYWEFNLSPSGHWNVYRFAAYRQAMQEEAALTSLVLAVRRQSDLLSLNLEADLGQITQADQAIEVAISTVLQGRDGPPTYWALAHCGPQTDFHLRDSFVVEL